MKRVVTGLVALAALPLAFYVSACHDDGDPPSYSPTNVKVVRDAALKLVAISWDSVDGAESYAAYVSSAPGVSKASFEDRFSGSSNVLVISKMGVEFRNAANRLPGVLITKTSGSRNVPTATPTPTPVPTATPTPTPGPPGVPTATPTPGPPGGATPTPDPATTPVPSPTTSPASPFVSGGTYYFVITAVGSFGEGPESGVNSFSGP